MEKDQKQQLEYSEYSSFYHSDCAYDEASIASHSFGVRLWTTQLVRAICFLFVWPELTSAKCQQSECEAYQICPPADPQHETDSWPEEPIYLVDRFILCLSVSLQEHAEGL